MTSFSTNSGIIVRSSRFEQKLLQIPLPVVYVSPSLQSFKHATPQREEGTIIFSESAKIVPTRLISHQC